ncbi:MAG: endo-1,4-beta-xylanase, partial [Lachnospiraceae bacterium]|nr:endo-1,4-beta-xylanase [Lachnospiraceae bacterium]
MRKSVKQILAGTIAGVMMLGLTAVAAPAPGAEAAAKKPKLSKKKVTVTVKKTKKIKIKNTKGIKKTTWSVKSKKIAKLSKKKKTSVVIKGVKQGKTTVTAKVKTKKKTYKLKLKVTVQKAATPVPSTKPTTKPSVKPSGKPTTPPAVDADIELDRTTLTVPFLASIQLNAIVTPESEASRVVWSSDNTAVATVTNGMVKGEGPGTATITAAIGSKKATCAVTVTKEEFGTVVMDCNFNDGVIEPWGPRNTQTEVTAVIDEDGYEGKCLRITDRTSQAQGALLDLSEMVEPSATYEFSTYVRLADTASDNAAIILSTETKAVANGDETYANVKCITSKKSNWGCAADYILKDPRQWNQVTYIVTTPDDVSHFGLYFEGGNSANDDLYVDSTSLKLLSRNTPDYTIPSLYEAYKDIFPNMGVAVDYNALMGENTMRFIKAQYNSVTMGNEMKPESILPGDVKATSFVTVEEAKELGYYVSDDYASYSENQKSGQVVYPKLRFAQTDALLKRAHDQGLKMRFHVLVWHQQTPIFFFKNTYASGVSRNNASVAAMNSRLEWYVKTVMEHLLKSPYADAIYAVDVVNEYFHSHNASDESVNTNGVTFWEEIYNTEDGSTGKMVTNPSYVKLA